jgi:hypothetical protein
VQARILQRKGTEGGGVVLGAGGDGEAQRGRQILGVPRNELVKAAQESVDPVALLAQGREGLRRTSPFEKGGIEGDSPMRAYRSTVVASAPWIEWELFDGFHCRIPPVPPFWLCPPIQVGGIREA